MKVDSSRSLERPVLEQQRPQRVAIDGDVAQRLRDDRGQEDGLPGEEVHLAEEARRAVADDLVAGRVEDRDLALDDRDEGVALVADAEQHVADAARCAPRRAARASPAATPTTSDWQGASRYEPIGGPRGHFDERGTIIETSVDSALSRRRPGSGVRSVVATEERWDDRRHVIARHDRPSPGDRGATFASRRTGTVRPA